MPVRSAFLALFIVASSAACSLGQSTAFTYQGQLKDNGQAVNGSYDLRFALYTAESDGVQVGTTQCVDNVAVVDGAFTTTIDFGQQFDATTTRYLQVDVRQDTGLVCSNTTGFTALSPRQAITATPLANHAKSAFSLDAPGGLPNAVVVDFTGRVGIGTTTPVKPVHISVPGPSIVLQDTRTTGQSGLLAFWDSIPSQTGWIGFGTSSSPDFSIVNDRPAGDVLILAPGNVGIGTNAPTTKLDVRGEIRFGSTGQYRPVACESDVRIVRGTVAPNGIITAGAGFTVSHPQVGEYIINFSPAFSGTPTVTVTTSGALNGIYTIANVITPVSRFSVEIGLVTAGGSAYAEREFNFIAIGPK